MLASVLFLAPMLSVPATGAQEPNVLPDPYPLRPPDTTSPRDTLRSFLTNADELIRAWRRDTLDFRSERAWMSTIMALDYSMTPNSTTWSAQTERVILLKEILDRVEVPPYDEIPGDEETADGAVTRWTIPNTRITIARMEYGPQEGEFLFSAATVERLYRSYMLVKDLPYKPGASTPGVYEAYTSADNTLGALEKQLRVHLRRVNTSSPRSTLMAFLDNVNQAYALVMEADAALGAKPRTMTRKQALDVEKRADNLLRRAAGSLDLSRVPAAHREAASIEAVLKLKEILDRTLLPTLETIPNYAMVAAVQQRESQSSLRPAGPFRWEYPNTEIEIVEIMEGDRQGEFLFSASTVSRVGAFYTRVRQLPYRTRRARVRISKYNWSEVSERFYDFVFSQPGYLVPRSTVMGRLVDFLPGWLKAVSGGQALWQWTTLLFCVSIAALAIYAILRVLKLLAARLNSPLDDWLVILAPAFIIVVVATVDDFIDRNVNLFGTVRIVVTTTSHVVVIIMVIWAVIRFCKAVAETVIASPKIRERSLDASLVRIIVRIAAFLIGAWIFIVSVRDLGADFVPLLAGLGVGGLAVALAAQRTFANFIGSLILFANKPVKPGDFCRYGDQLGTVEHIGLLSTRIRSLERTIITVPNAEFSEMKLDNLAMRDRRLLRTVLQLRYETTPEQMRYILAKLRELLLGHPKVTPEPARVRFVGYGAYSKDLEIFAYLDCQDQNTFLAMQEDVLLRIEDIVNEAGSGFAFPSQTAYLSRDKGLDIKRGSEAEAQVEQWRDSGKLPFPEFGGQEREQLENTLDYPPEGSPDYQPTQASGDGQTETGPSTFSVDDFVDLPSLAAKLQETNRLASYLWDRLSVKTKKLLSDYSDDMDAEARKALVQDLNAVVHGPSIYAVDRFRRIKRRRETQDLLDANPSGDDLARLNRLLLEDAYPELLSRKA
jgi:MscS family membrane protein